MGSAAELASTSQPLKTGWLLQSVHSENAAVGFGRVPTGRSQQRGGKRTNAFERQTADADVYFMRQAAIHKNAGCRRIFEAKVSGAKRDRTELARLLDQIRDDEIIVVMRLDRLA